MIFWNVQGLRKKARDISKYLERHDLIAITETWMEEKDWKVTEKHLPQEFKWLWTSAVRRKTKGRAAGGLVIGIRNGIEYRDFNSNFARRDPQWTTCTSSTRQ